MLKKAKFAEGVDIERDWKLITIFSGMDDVVFGVNKSDPIPTPTADFEAGLEALLNAVRLRVAVVVWLMVLGQTHSNFPRSFVNMLMLPEKFDTGLMSETMECRAFKRVSEMGGMPLTLTDSGSSAYDLCVALTGIIWSNPEGWLNSTVSFNRIISKVAAVNSIHHSRIIIKHIIKSYSNILNHIII